MSRQVSRRKAFSALKHQRRELAGRARHELFEHDGVMMSVHFTSEPTDEDRQIFRDLVRQIATGEIKMPPVMTDPGRILSVRKKEP